MVRGFDADRQAWVGSEQELRIAELHRRAAALQRLALLVCLNVLVICGLAYGTWALTWKDEPRPVAQFQPREKPRSPGKEDSPTASPTASPTGSVPSGFQTVSESEFSTVVPQGWDRSTKLGDGDVRNYFYDDPDGGPGRIQIFRITGSNLTPHQAMKEAETYLQERPGYESIGIKDIDDPRGSAAELDYSYDMDDGTRVRVLDRIVHADGDQLYAILVRGPVDDWPKQQQIQQPVLAALCFTSDC